jgi:hypothetical protein
VPFDLSTFGAIADFTPNPSFATVREAVLAAITSLLAKGAPLALPHASVPVADLTR